MAMLRTVALLSSLVLAASLVNAEEEKEKPGAENEKERIDTEHLFGFMLGRHRRGRRKGNSARVFEPV
jgi:hypothetical protein